MVFAMWKLKGAEPMVHTDADRRLPFDEPSASFGASFDLNTGKISKSGDLNISVVQDPVVVKRRSDPFTWNLKITVPGGGLVEATDLYKNLAPEKGYQSDFSFGHKKDDPNWVDRVTKTFYVHTAKGQYARVSIDLVAGTNRPERGLGIGLGLAIWLNPSGSRNLEFDETKAIKPGAAGGGML
jgi:hypothetical protein